MFKSKKRILFIIVSLLLVSLAVLVATPLTRINASSQEDSSCISYQTQQNPTFTLSAYTAKRSRLDSNQNATNKESDIYNNQYILLKHDESFNDYYNKIGFDISSDTRTKKYITKLNINAYLNGVAINLDVKNRLNPNLQGSTLERYLEFEISRETPITYQNEVDEFNNPKTVEDIQGHYEFYFNISLYDETTQVTTNEPANYSWYKFEFTVIDEDQYSSLDQVPTLQNVDVVNANTNEYKNNYIYDGSTNYAQINFDAERYKLMITRVFEGKSEKIETRFAYFTDSTFATSSATKTNYAKVFFDFKDKTVSFNLTRTSTSLPFVFKESNYTYLDAKSSNYTMPLFYELGEYTIKPYYQVYQNGSILYDNSTNSPVDIAEIKLTVYGFNLNYAYNLTDTKYFISFEKNITTDFSADLSTPIENLQVQSTNQAPVWFNTQTPNVSNIKYYHTTNKSEFFAGKTVSEIINDDSANWNTVNKNYYFTESGYYAVVCSYGFSSLSPVENKLFLFQIQANTPTVTLKIADNNNTTLVSGGYTNNNVYVELTKEGPFDSIVNAQYALNTNFSNTFTNYLDFTTKKGNNEDYTRFSSAGKYSIKVMFGKQSASYYTFVIDKSDIKDYVKANLVKTQKLNQSEIKYVASTNVTDKTILKDSFTVIIQEKPSKAKIEAKLTTVDIQSYEPNQSEVYSTNGTDPKEYINARYQATFASSPNEYGNIVSNVASYIDAKFVFKEHKIYIFEISDEAGFKYEHIVYLDKANANVLEFDANNSLIETTEYNIVSSKTNVVWSKNKGIEFKDKNSLGSDEQAIKRNTDAMGILEKYTDFFQYNGTTLVLIVPITDVNITSTNLDGSTTSGISGALYSSYKTSNNITVYGLLSEADSDNVPATQRQILSGEKIYTISITDQSGITTTYNVEVNMDKSLGKAYTLNNGEVNYTTSNRLNLKRAGSLDHLVFEWKDDDEIDSPFAIASLTYSFYPLTYNKNDKATFPYASTPTKVDVDLMQDMIYDAQTNLYHSTPINTTHITYYDNSSGVLVQKQKVATEAGKYVIKRTYVGSANEVSAFGDELVKEYEFYVDRNPIINYPQSDIGFDLGGGVKLLFGDDGAKTFNEFYREPSSSVDVIYDGQITTTKIYTTLESNLLPIKVKVPANKYSVLSNTGIDTSFTNLPSTFALVATLWQFDSLGNQIGEAQTCSQVDSKGYLVINDIKQAGYYLLQIRDNSVTPNNQISPNLNTTTYFAFQVDLSGPKATLSSSNERATIAGEQPLNLTISGNEFIYTFDNNVVSTYTYTMRTLDVNNPNTNTPFQGRSDGSAYQPASGNRYRILTDDGKINQYRFEVVYTDASKPKTTLLSPLYTDYNNYIDLPNNSATKDNYIVLKLEEPSEEYMASIDYNDIKITRYEKINGAYSKGVDLQQGVDYILQQRLNPSTSKILYSIEIFAVDESSVDSSSKEYRFDVTYHFKGAKENFQTTENNQTVSYYSNSETVYVDKSAPTYNITRLASQENNTRILSALNMRAYNSYNYKDNNNTYFYANVSSFDFAIDANFVFSRPITTQGTIDTQEGYALYVRKFEYGKYDTSAYQQDAQNQALQAVVPGDPNFVSSTNANLKFNAQNPLWHRLDYYDRNDSARENYTFVKQLLNNPSFGASKISDLYGYYEIVEVDAVGNHTIYTVLFNQGTPSFTFEYNTAIASNIQDVFPRVQGTETIERVSSYNNASLIGVNSIDSWYTLSVDNNYLTINVNPTSDMQEVLSAINQAINRGNNSYTLTISNRFGSSVIVPISISFSVEKFNVTSSTTVNDDGFYTVTFEDDKDGLIMSKVRVYKFNSENKMFEEFVNEDGQFIDVTGKVLSVNKNIDSQTANPNYSRVYNYDEGIYKFYIEDNFNFGDNATVVSLNIGDNASDYKIAYSGTKILYQGKTYTTDNVTVTANSSRYTTLVTRNGSSITVQNDEFILEAPSQSMEANIVSGGEYKYVVTILDNVTGEEIVEEFIIYNIFPAVSAKNSRNNNMDKILSTSRANVSSFTSDSVYLSYSGSGYTFGYSFSLRRYENLNSEEYTTINAGSSGSTVYAKGAYELIIKNNTLNSTRSIFFVIRESTLSMYSVAEKLPNGTLNVIAPSSDLLDASNYRTQIQNYLASKGKEYNFGATLNIKNYFSIYDFEVTVDGDKGLSTNWGKGQSEQIIYTQITGSASNSTNIVVVYGTTPYNYLDVFAVTKIAMPTDSRLIEFITYSYTEEIVDEQTGEKTSEVTRVDVPTANFDNVSIYSSPVTISWQSYFDVPLNKIFMSYYYNDKYIGIVEPSDDVTTSITFNDDGKYRLKFYDLAGNTMLFGDGMYTDFTINVKSYVDTLINGIEPIYGAVYNDSVTFAVKNPDSYTQLNIEVYLNGELQKSTRISRNSPSITFDSSGFYKLIVNGSTRTSTSNVKNLKTKEIAFTIINPNESKFAYEFASISGYEITKVVRNGFDITNEISQNNAGIYNLVLSEDVNGIGKYSITVNAEFINSLREPVEFSFDVWINNKIPTLNVNTKRNEISTDTIVITYNAKALYEQLGDCKIVIGSQEFEINSSSLNSSNNTVLTIDTAGTYYITLVTKSGNVISVYKVIKQDPLNFLSIILIVIGVGVLIAGIYLFYRLRVKMKIK